MPATTIPSDVFGQTPRLFGLYTQLCFCFPLQGLHLRTQRAIGDYLYAGAERLVKHVPWLGGSVIQSPSGEYLIQYSGSVPAVLCRDLRRPLSDYDDMREARFPSSMLDETIIAPRRTLQAGNEEAPPVMMLQANFVKGGLLLVVIAQHNCINLRGQAQCIEVFAKACRNEDFTSHEIAIANTTTFVFDPLPRESLKVFKAKPKQIVAPQPLENGLTESHDLSKTRWLYFVFSETALQRLKATTEPSKQVDSSLQTTR